MAVETHIDTAAIKPPASAPHSFVFFYNTTKSFLHNTRIQGFDEKLGGSRR